MFCKNCGREIDPNSNACPNCGAFQNGNPNMSGNAYTNMNNSNLDLKSKMAGGLFGIFLGAFGVHNFYLGYTGKAIAQLLITVLSCGILSAVSAIWGLIEGILILTGSIGVDGQGRPLRD